MEYEVGTIMQFGHNSEKKGWKYCDGRKLLISEYQELYSVIGCSFGGDFRKYFNLPDLRPKDSNDNFLRIPFAEKINGVHYIPSQICVVGRIPQM